MHGTGILGWEPNTKSLVHHEFLSNGDYFTVRYTKIDDKKWGGEIKGIYDGKPNQSKCDVDWKGDSWEYRDMTAGKPFVFKGVRR